MSRIRAQRKGSTRPAQIQIDSDLKNVGKRPILADKAYCTKYTNGNPAPSWGLSQRTLRCPGSPARGPALSEIISSMSQQGLLQGTLRCPKSFSPCRSRVSCKGPCAVRNHFLFLVCSADLDARFRAGSLTVTSLDNNGIDEIWLVYRVSCHGYKSPSPVKVIIHEGAKK